MERLGLVAGMAVERRGEGAAHASAPLDVAFGSFDWLSSAADGDGATTADERDREPAAAAETRVCSGVRGALGVLVAISLLLAVAGLSVGSATPAHVLAQAALQIAVLLTALLALPRGPHVAEPGARQNGAGATLRTRATDLRRISEGLEDVYYRTDLDGVLVDVSPSVTRYGYTVEELIGTDSRPLYEDAIRRHENAAQLHAHGLLRDHELVLLAKAGERVPVSANVRLLRDERGRPCGIEGLLRDIRERKRAEEELRAANERLDERVRARTADLQVANALLRDASEVAREAERRFRTVSELSSDYAYCCRLTPEFASEVEWITAASFERVTGYAIGELDALGGGIGLVHPDDAAVAQERVLALLSGRPDVSEFRIVRKDGTIRWIREHGYAERAADGRDVRIYGAAQDVTERKRAQGELAAALRQRENVMETVPDVIYRIDCEGRLVDWNRRLEVVSGRERSGIAGASATSFFVADDRVRIREAIEAAFADRYAAVEARMETPDGPRLYHYSAVPLCDEHGVVVGLTGVGRDISELKDAERRTAMLLDVARDVSGTLDVDEIVARVQHRTADLLPCDMVATLCREPDSAVVTIRSLGVATELAPQLEALVHPLSGPLAPGAGHDEPIVLADVAQLAAIAPGGSLIAAPMRARGRDRGWLLAIRRAGAAPFAPTQVALCDGLAAQMAVTLEGAELHGRQQEEAAISRALARVGQELIAALDGPDLLARLCEVTVETLGCDASLTALHRVDEQTYVSVAGHGFAPEVWDRIRLLDVPAALVPVGAADDADGVRRIDVAQAPALGRSLAESLGMRHVLLMPLLRGSEQIGVHVACWTRPERGIGSLDERIGRRVAQLASLVIDHARAVAETSEASRLKSEFVATMSHELRTPLNVIVGYNEMLLDGAFGDMTDEQREPLLRADRSARGLLGLISDTLDLSRLEAGRVALDYSRVALGDLARELVGEAREQLRKRDVVVCCEIGDELPPLYTDAGKLRVVLRNLLGNALKFTDAGEIRLVAAAFEGGVEFQVQDSGIGIPADAVGYLFEPFRQGDGSNTRQHDGAGLGLYIVRRLLDVLGGSVLVSSQLGVGSTFRVRLPLSPEGRIAA